MAKVYAEGRAVRGDGGFDTYALCGYVRDKGEADMALTALIRANEAGAGKTLGKAL